MERKAAKIGTNGDGNRIETGALPDPFDRARESEPEPQMSVIATVSIPASEFPLGSVLDADRDATVSVETTVPADEGSLPYLWVPADVADSVVDELDDNGNVTDAAVVDELEDSALVRVEWDDRLDGVLEAIRSSDAIVTSAAGTASQWTFRLRFPSYEDLSEFYTACVEDDVSIELAQLHEAVGSDQRRRFGLTNAQRDLVVAAYEAGYFDVPRKTTLVELGERLGISDSAVSQRLRRGLAELISATLVMEPQSKSRSRSRSSGGGPDRFGTGTGAGSGAGPGSGTGPEEPPEP
ncbi:helix-turn-helix domain-containing protein [Halopiger xanaduensis]|uniref:helix-turn-helix domain-containing protein n=1 Tax=Halopiger xanaduensis TaxID=387343 RepID=UPI00373FDF8E